MTDVAIDRCAEGRTFQCGPQVARARAERGGGCLVVVAPVCNVAPSGLSIHRRGPVDRPTGAGYRDGDGSDVQAAAQPSGRGPSAGGVSRRSRRQWLNGAATIAASNSSMGLTVSSPSSWSRSTGSWCQNGFVPLASIRACEISGHDTAAGWTLFNPLDWAYLCARLPDEGAEEIYGRGANLVIAAQFGRPMQAAPVQDGYRITGRAPFVSNCHDANWIATSAVIAGDQTRPDDKGEPALVMVYLPRESCQVIDTWHVIGMRGTGSNDVEVSDVFVPTARTFPIVPEFTPGSHYRVPLYRFPIMGISASSLPPLILAVARRAIDEVSALAQGKVPVARSTPLRERASAQAKLARAEAALRAGRVLLYDTLSEAWQATVAGDALSLRQKADLLLAMTHAVSS